MDLKDCLAEEYTVDWGNPFGERRVHIKTPMRFEDFGEEEKAMLLTKNYIRDHTTLTIHRDNSARVYRLEAAFQVSINDPVLKASAVVQMIDPDVDHGQIRDTKEKLTDILIQKVQTYYEVQIYKEEKKMPVSMHYCDEICEYLGLTTKTPTPSNKPKWIEGLPAVKKVETYNQRVVKVTFIDDTFTKSVCSENDHFDIDVGITICLLKRIMGSNGDDATRNYNKLMNQVHAVMEKNEKEMAAEKAKKEADKVKKRKAELKKAAKKLKAKEEQIDIYKQGILRAMNEREDDMK